MGHFFVFFSPSITQLIPCLYIAKCCNSFRCKDTIHFIHESHQYFGKESSRPRSKDPLLFSRSLIRDGLKIFTQSCTSIFHGSFHYPSSNQLTWQLNEYRPPANFPLARSKYTDLSRGWVQVTVEWIGNRFILYVVVFFIFCCCFERDSKFTAKMRCYSQCNVAAPPRETSVQCIVTEAHQVVRDRDRTVVG